MRFKILVVAVLIATTASALTVKQASIKKLTADAALVVTGTVAAQEARWDDGNIYTYVTLDIARCLKGQAPGKTVVVKNYGGTVGEISEVVAGAPVFAEGKEVLLFLTLWRGDYFIHSIALGGFDIVQEGGARYAVNDLSHVTLVDPVTHKEIAEPGQKRTKIELESFVAQVRAFAR